MLLLLQKYISTVVCAGASFTQSTAFHHIYVSLSGIYSFQFQLLNVKNKGFKLFSCSMEGLALPAVIVHRIFSEQSCFPRKVPAVFCFSNSLFPCNLSAGFTHLYQDWCYMLPWLHATSTVLFSLAVGFSLQLLLVIWRLGALYVYTYRGEHVCALFSSSFSAGCLPLPSVGLTRT